MIVKKNDIKIATILPYKESYTLEYASAVSLWVSQFFKKSKFKNKNFIYGNANSKDYLTENYINIPLENLELKFRSTSNEYIEKLSKKIIDGKFDIVEVHNRPLVLFKLIKTNLSTFLNISFLSEINFDPDIVNGSLW